MVADGEGRARGERIGLGGPLLLSLSRFGDVRQRRRRTARDIAEVLPDPLLRLCRIEIAGDDEHGIAGNVVSLEEGACVFERRRVDVLQVAVEVVGVVPVGIGVLRQLQPRKAAIRLIEHVDLHFLLDHALLVHQIFLGDIQTAHAVGLGPQHRFQRVRGKGFEVVGEVEARRAIQRAAESLDQFEKLSLGEILRALKHQVLEEMRKARAILRLDAEADVVVDADGGHRHRMIRGKHDAKPVVELVVLDGNVQRRDGRCVLRHRRKRAEGERQDQADGDVLHRRASSGSSTWPPCESLRRDGCIRHSASSSRRCARPAQHIRRDGRGAAGTAPACRASPALPAAWRPSSAS